jgi:hypothetical protein
MMSNRSKSVHHHGPGNSTLKLNINQLAGITGVHRQTVAARLKNSSLRWAATTNSNSTSSPMCSPS